MLFGDGRQGRIVRRLAEQVDGDDGGGLQPAFLFHRFNGVVELGRINIIGVGLDVDEDRLGARHRHHFGGGDEGEGRHENGVPLANAETQQDQFDGVGAIGAGQAMGAAGEFRHVGFEGPDLRTHDIGAVVDHLQHRAFDGGADARLLGAEIDERDGHGETFSQLPQCAVIAL